MKSFALLAVSALGLSACNDDKLVPDNGNADGKFVTVHFGAEAAIEGATKATLTPNEAETMFASAWEKDKDAICVSYKNGGAKLTTTTGTWDGTTFLAGLPAYTGMWEYQACYPCLTNEEVPFGSARKQKGNLYNSDYDIMITSKVSVNNGAAGKDDKGNDIVFQMDRQTGIVYFHLTSSLEEEVVSAKLSVEGGNIASSYALLGPSAFTAKTDLKEITITFTEAPTAKDIRLWFNVLPTSYTSMSLVVETTGHTLTLNNSNPGTFAARKLYKVKGDVSSKWIKKGGETPEPTVYVWDLAINSTSEASENQIGWTNDAADMLCVKGESTTNANNYYPGTSGKSYTSTRFYNNSTLSITPKVGKSLCYYVFEATSDSYAKALANSTWTNATASVDAANAKVVYIVATDPAKAVSAKIGAKCGFTKVECHKDALSLTPVIKPASTSITVPSNGGEQSITYTIQYPEDGKALTAVSSETWINSIKCGTAGTVTFVADANEGAERNATITLSYPGAEDVAVTVSQSAKGAVEPIVKTEEFTFSSFEVTDGVATINATNFTIELKKENANNPPAWNKNSGEARLYAGGSLKVISNKTIKKVELTYVLNAGGKKKVVPTINSVKGSKNVGTWDSVEKIWQDAVGDNMITMLTSGSAGNVGFTKIKVTYVE